MDICIRHRGANTDGVILVCRAETRLFLTGVEPGQDTLSGSWQGVWVESSLSEVIKCTCGLSGNTGLSSCQEYLDKVALNRGNTLPRWRKGLWVGHKRRRRVGGYKLRKASKHSEMKWGELTNPNPLASVLESLAFFLIYSCVFVSLCSPFSCLVIAVPSSPQGAGCSVLLGEACVCVSQPSHSLQKWPNLFFFPPLSSSDTRQSVFSSSPQKKIYINQLFFNITRIMK